MKQRVKTGAVIILVTLLAIISKFLPYDIGTYIFDIFILVIAIVGGFEIANIMINSGKKVNAFMTTIYSVFYYAIMLLLVNINLNFFEILAWEYLFLAIYFFVSFIVEFFKDKKEKAKENIKTAFNTLLGCIYPGMLFCLMLNINHADIFAGVKYFSLVFIILIFVVTMVTDTMAYFVGSKLRGPKLAPKISPNKTISGAVGGLIGGIIGALLVYFVLFKTPLFEPVFSMYNFYWWQFLLFGLFGSSIGQAGDLFESKLKREAGIKDSGNLFPGHGGMLDRVDAMTFVIVFIFVVVSIFLM